MIIMYDLIDATDVWDHYDSNNGIEFRLKIRRHAIPAFRFVVELKGLLSVM